MSNIGHAIRTSWSYTCTNKAATILLLVGLSLGVSLASFVLGAFRGEQQAAIRALPLHPELVLVHRIMKGQVETSVKQEDVRDWMTVAAAEGIVSTYYTNINIEIDPRVDSTSGCMTVIGADARLPRVLD